VRRLVTARVAAAHEGFSLSLASRSPGRGSRRTAIYAAALSDGIFGVVPVLFTAFFMYTALRAHAFAVDFHNGEWPAGVRILHGLSPYFDPHSAAVLSAGSPHPTVTPMVYPAIGALLFAALALLPHTLADATFTCLDMAAVLVALRLLGVRDRRVYGVVFLWPPVVSGWQTANITLLLVLGLAAVWRFRDRPALSGVLLAALVSIKLILWPLGLWLLATRRYLSLTYAMATGLALNVAAWAVLGFNELPRYLRVLQAFDGAGERRAYSTVSLALHLGASHPAAVVLGFGLASFAAVACVASGWRGRERTAFTLCIAVVLLATPIIWLHYFALLIVPLALARPRLSAVWALPLLLFVCPPTSPSTRQIILGLCVSAALLLVVLHGSASTSAKLRRSANSGA
jgi:hypothetical protein